MGRKAANNFTSYLLHTATEASLCFPRRTREASVLCAVAIGLCGLVRVLPLRSKLGVHVLHGF